MKIQLIKTNKGDENTEKIIFTPCLMYGADANERMFGLVIFNLLLAFRMNPKKVESDTNTGKDGKKAGK